MRLLWVATKPPWPPTDGGRLLLASTIAAVAAAGHVITVVAPARARADGGVTRRDADASTGGGTEVPDAGLETLHGPPSGVRVWIVAERAAARLAGVVQALAAGTPLALARHVSPAVRRAVARLAAEEPFAVVVAEQVQALAQCTPARARGLPVVLRAQNIESEIWAGAAVRRPALRAILAHAARSLARAEGAAVRAVAATIALTAEDAARLDDLARGGVAGRHVRDDAAAGAVATRAAGAHSAERRSPSLHIVPAPFPPSLPVGPPLPGAPALVLLASRGFAPNADAVRWFADRVWPAVRRCLPGAVLHSFGEAPSPAPPGSVIHGVPAASAAAFPAGGIVVVPLRFGSGVRLRILEAWARGVPVVATPAAVRGLAATSGRELLIAEAPDGFAAAVAAVHGEPALRARLVEGGRTLLRARHDPRVVAAAFAAVCEGVRRGDRTAS